MFFEFAGSIYRVLIQDDNGAWVIVYGSTSEPQFISTENFKAFTRIETPKEYIEAIQLFETGALTLAAQSRYLMIKPLLSDDRYIRDVKARRLLLKEIAEKNGTTSQRLNRVYLLFLSSGRFIRQRQKNTGYYGDYDDIFLWAIRTYYFSAKKLSLKDAYCNMLLSCFTSPDGTLSEDIPTFNRFRKFYFRHQLHRSAQKEISRNGLSDFQRNKRLLYGSAMRWRDKIGSFQMDATQADIYLVSRFDKSVIGRPNIYLAVDTATQLVAGFYVGLDAGETAIMACLCNAAEDKVAYCKKYGIVIEQWQWPSHGIPKEIITDKGQEFVGKTVEALCMQFGVICQSLPPFRPDGKGLVEKAFDMLQQRYKPILRGKGVIETDAKERWATDYRTQAVLDLTDFTKVLIHAILYLNSGRILPSFEPSVEMATDKLEPIAAKIWCWMEANGMSDILDVEEEKLKILAMPKLRAKVSRKGIQCRGLWYSSKEIAKDGVYIGQNVTIAYDPQDVSFIYILSDKGDYQMVPLAKGKEQYAGISFFEYDLFQADQKNIRAVLEREETIARVTTIQQIKQIAENAGNPKTQKIDGSVISKNRRKEKGRHI